MALSSGYKKITRTQKQSDGNYKKISEWTSSTSVERDNGETIETSVSKLESDLSSLSKTVTNNKTSWGDKYTKNEIDNKFSTLETNIDWKESVATYSDIAKMYPNPADGWTVNVKDTDYTYRYNGTGWVAISANAIPKATTSVDGLLSKTDKAHYDDAYSKRHTHSNKSVIDGITSTLVNNWNSAKTHADSAHAPSNAQANVIEIVKVNGSALTPSSKAVNVTVPIKVSQLTNDSGYKTTDNNTTYSLSKSGSTITLTGSDGSKTSVSDSDTNTTYPIAYKTIDGSFITKYRTQTKGNTANGDYISTIRTEASGVNYAPQFGSGLAWGRGDTHGYLYTAYPFAEAYLGGGNADTLNWVKRIQFTDGTGASGTWGINITGTATNATKVNNHTVEANVPANAKFTDTDTWRPLGTTADSACAGNDSRLSNARPASDVYAWAKASTKPSYSWSEITGKPSAYTPSSHTHIKSQISDLNIRLSSSENLNNIKTVGFYFTGGINTITNKPPGVDAFGLEVLQSAAGWYTQKLYSSNNMQKSYRRWYNGSSWTTWEEEKITDTNTWRGIQNNLTSTSTTDSLSAFMGKQLKSMIDTLITTGYYDTMWSNDAGSMNYYIRFSTGIMIMVTIIPDGWSVENNTHYIYPVSFINNNYALIAVDNTSTNGQTSGGFDRRIPMIRHERNYFTVWSNSVTPGDDNFYNEGIEDSMSVICIGRWK